MKSFLLLLLLLPSLACAQQRPASMEMRKNPVYVDVQPHQLVIYPEKRKLSDFEIETPTNEFERLLEQMEQVQSSRYVGLILRPGSVVLQRSLRHMIQAHNLQIGFEPMETETSVLDGSNSLQNPKFIPSSGVEVMDLETVTSIFDNQTNHTPCDIEVGTNSITILANHMVVARDELNLPDNAFVQHLGRISTFPKVFCRQPGSDETYARLMKCIYDWGIKPHGWWITAVARPIEVPANGRAPFYLECRGDNLFSVSADAPAAEFDISNLKSLDPATQYICLLVRPDSFAVFRQARKAAWELGLDVSCELQDESAPLAIGSEGKPLFPQPQ